MAFNAGGVRAKLNLETPSAEGAVENGSVYRAHINTLEQVESFIPVCGFLQFWF